MFLSLNLGGKRDSVEPDWLSRHLCFPFYAAQTFKGESAVTAMEVIAKARVPIIKLRFNNLQVRRLPPL